MYTNYGQTILLDERNGSFFFFFFTLSWGCFSPAGGVDNNFYSRYHCVFCFELGWVFFTILHDFLFLSVSLSLCFLFSLACQLPILTGSDWIFVC